MGHWSNFNLHDPWWLLLLVFIPLVTWYRERKKKEKSSAALDMPIALQKVPVTWKIRFLRWIEPGFWLAVGFIIIAMARPQTQYSEEIVKGEGIDIFLVMDLSSSMLARDFNPDRLTVSKRVATDFISHRTYDGIGLVVFAGESYTQCPLTHDHEVLTDYLQSLESVWASLQR